MNNDGAAAVITCLRCVVTGEVQGVFYRATTRRKAEQLGVTGWARNTPDGAVEVMVCGDEAKCVNWWRGYGRALRSLM